MKETSEMLVLPEPCLQVPRGRSSRLGERPRPPGTRLGSLINHDDGDNDDIKKKNWF